MKTMSHWPFDDSGNTVVFASRQVLEENALILRMSHDADDGYRQFHPTEARALEDARILALQEVVEIDPSVGEHGDLPVGWIAIRSGVEDPWHRYQRCRTFDEEAG